MTPTSHIHHEVPIAHTVPGTDGSRAYWVDATTLAWPPELIPAGTHETALRLGLLTSPTGSVSLEAGVLRLGDDGYEIPLRPVGTLDEDIVAAHPQLAGYLALSLLDETGAPRLERGDVEKLLTGQVAVLQRAAAGWVTAFTGVQTWPVIDRLWGTSAAARDGSAPLGVWFDESDGAPAFALWAPTARRVTLLTWDTGDPTGSVPDVNAAPVRTPADHAAGHAPGSWDGRWEVSAEISAAAGVRPGCQYLWEVEVYVPDTGRIETNLVTDPCSRALTRDSHRSVAVDLDQQALTPAAWAETQPPVVAQDSARAIYELHVRDFSAADHTVPAALRGTYAAFGVDSAGTRHLRALAEAGIDTIHLLPVFDFSSVPEDRAHQRVPQIPSGTTPASRRPQAAVAVVADRDAYNWGYDPFHWMAPEGSYAREGHQDGGARTREMRAMIGSLHAMGLQVILDQVYNHTADGGQGEHSVLDRVVPGYYHRLDAAGRGEGFTCCHDIATERAMAERLMIDACVGWVRDYRVDGFRFDLMGYHSTATMAALRQALDEIEDEAVGHRVFLYGEGWEVPEASGGRHLHRAIQGQVGSGPDGGYLGIGTFNDRVRDGLLGERFLPDLRLGQGLATGVAVDPNEHEERPADAAARDLAWRTELVQLSLAGNLRTAGGPGYGHSVAAYGDEPVDSIAYVEAHDDESLFDWLVYKLPVTTPMHQRVRAQLFALAAVTLGQTPCFWSAGTELLRSKSLDRDSYNSGDHFNAIDWTGQDTGWGRGLPPAERNFDRWLIQADLLVREDLRPRPEDVAKAREMAFDLLRLRRSTPLLTLGSAELVRERVSFPLSGKRGVPGVIVMVVDDGGGDLDIDPALDGVAVALNARPETVTVRIEELTGRYLRLSDIQRTGADDVVRATHFDPATGELTVPGRTAAVLVEH